MSLLALLFTFVLMWLLLIRPQQQRVRRHQALVASLGLGDDVVTAGGICGTILALDESTVSLEVAPGVVLRVVRGAITERVQQPGPDEGLADVVDDEPTESRAEEERP